MLVEVSLKDFDLFVSINKGDKSLKTLCSGNCLVLFKNNFVIAVSTDEKIYLSEEVVNKIRGKENAA